MTTSEAAGGRQVYYYIKFCPVDPRGCRGGPWNKDRWRHTKEEAVAMFRQHLYNKHPIVSDQLMQTYCDALEFETYNDPAGVKEPPEPPTPPPVMTSKPKQLALTPPPAKRTLAEKASERTKRRMKTEKPDEPPDEPPAPEPDEATAEIGRHEMAAFAHATEAIETSLANAKKLAMTTRLFAVTMDDAVTTLSNLLEAQLQ